MSSLQSSLSYLFNLEQFGVKLGLNNIRTLCRALEHPERHFTTLIIAGTNGKGSVAAIIETALRATGYKTGLYTSPHLTKIEERFVINGAAVSQATLEYEVNQLRTTINRLCDTNHLETSPTFFEATTAIALSLFKKSGVDVAVLEVGMGGRFDATNVVTPVAAAITSIDLDHQRFLGSTLQAIAFEKAGVIKSDMVVVAGKMEQSANQVLREACHKREAKLVESNTGVRTRVVMRNGVTELELTTPVRCYGPITLALRGRHQARNAVVAVRLLEELRPYGLEVKGDAIETALSQTQWPGRLDLIRVENGREVLLDAAHNPAAATALTEYLREVHPRGIPLVFGSLRDKDVREMVTMLRHAVTHITCVPLENDRAHTPNELVEIVRTVDSKLPVEVAESPRSGLNLAWDQAGFVCAAGSVYLVGELINELRTNNSNRALTGAPG